MKTILPYLLGILLLSGCATTSTSTVKVDKPKEHCVGLLTLIGNVDTDFNQLDSATYEQHIRGKFNNLERSRYRDQLEKTLARNLVQGQTGVVKSSEVFDINTDIPYNQFLEKVRATGVDGILFVNQRNYWYNSQVITTFSEGVSTSTVDTEPNAAYHTYLIDLQTLKPVWYAHSIVYGVWAGFDTLNNYLARDLYRKLRKDRYILNPYAATPM